MKDIDFDELDKAVNSLMASGGPSVTTTETPEKVVTIPSSASGVEATPAVQTQATVVEQAVTVAPATPLPVAVTVSPPVAPAVRRGRFMDMVPNPSGASNRSVASTAPSREGLSITPREDTPVAAAQPVESATPPLDKPVVTVAPSEPAETAASFDTMPDPIDSMPVEEPVAAPVPADQQYESQVVSAVESPFLSDAVVEKRPLNSSNLGLELEEAAKQETTVEESAEAQSAPADDTKADEPPVTPQVPELNGDLVAIESGQVPEATQAIDTADAASQVAVPSTPLGATSIPQQYKAKESSGDQSHAAIYDAAQYPEPLNHPAKSKSGWLWVLWVIVLLGIGAGGAVLLYVLGIIP